MKVKCINNTWNSNLTVGNIYNKTGELVSSLNDIYFSIELDIPY